MATKTNKTAASSKSTTSAKPVSKAKKAAAKPSVENVQCFLVEFTRMRDARRWCTDHKEEATILRREVIGNFEEGEKEVNLETWTPVQEGERFGSKKIALADGRVLNDLPGAPGNKYRVYFTMTGWMSAVLEVPSKSEEK